jgi:prepilin-type N-terminal cleavage/methylation domain-containing protein
MRVFHRERGFTILETLFVVALIGIISAIAVPQLTNSLAYFRLSGDARSVSNAIAVTKMRAASTFSKTRLYVSLTGKWHRVESADTSSPPHWTVEGGQTYLSSNSVFGFGVVGTPPPSTQAAINQATPCKDNTGTAIANTACVIFNSRGVPVDGTTTFTPTADDAVYVTDGSAVYGVTVAATGMIRMWKTQPTASPTWLLQ